MTEYLAIPAWNTPGQPLSCWVDGLAEAGGGPVTVRRESSTVCWLLCPALHTEGYVELEKGQPVAINFEVNAAEPAHARAVLSATAHSIGWEIHDDDGDDDDRSDEFDVVTRDRPN